jgi:hypothetical protein
LVWENWAHGSHTGANTVFVSVGGFLRSLAAFVRRAILRGEKSKAARFHDEETTHKFLFGSLVYE